MSAEAQEVGAVDRGGHNMAAARTASEGRDGIAAGRGEGAKMHSGLLDGGNMDTLGFEPRAFPHAKRM